MLGCVDLEAQEQLYNFSPPCGIYLAVAPTDKRLRLSNFATVNPEAMRESETNLFSASQWFNWKDRLGEDAVIQ